MELNFDKEIDALLRQAAKSETLAVGANGSNSALHIDADALSAFAENALPEKTRALYMTHLGDCDRCRKILSNLIVLNSEADASAASFAAIPEIAVAPAPWYRKLFLFPNLAYTMGALVLVFSGLLGFVILRNLGNGATNVAGVANKQPAQSDAIAPAAMPSNANMPVAAANTAMNGNAAAPMEPGKSGFMGVDTNSVSKEQDLRENNFVLDGVDKSGPPAAGTTPDVNDDATRDGIVTRKPVTTEDEKKNEESISLARPAPPPPAPEPRAAGQTTTRPEDLPTNGRSTKDKDLRMQPAAPKKAAAESSGGQKQTGGKNFNRRDGVWYDSAYSGQSTTDVRRGTDQYRKLDSGLRSIADSLGGTVVVVWKSTAYRIQ